MTPSLAALPTGATATAPRDTTDPSACADGDGFAQAMQRHESATRTAAREPAAHDRPDRAPQDDGARTPAPPPRAEAAEPADAAAPREDTATPDAAASPIDAAAAERMLALLTGLAAAPAAAAPATATPTGAPLPSAPSAVAALPAPAPAAAPGLAAASTDAAPAGAALPPMLATAPSRDATSDAGDGLPALARTPGDPARGDSPPQAAAASELSATATTPLTGATPVQPAAPRAPAVLDAVSMPAAPADGFDDAFGARVAWMAEQKLGHAELRVTPADAGPIDIRLQVDGTRIRAEFNAVQADTRAALEASIPRLRDMLGQHGLQLAHADVGQRHAQPGQDGRPAAPSADGDASDAPVISPAQLVRSRGLLDEYA